MKLYDTYDFDGIGYQKLFNFKDWRIAELKFIEDIDAKPLDFLECHLETDEVFVLLEGSCKMWFFDENKPDQGFKTLKLKKHEVFRIPQGIYHGHRLSKDAKILIIEEENTCNDNSHRIYLNEKQLSAVRGIQE